MKKKKTTTKKTQVKKQVKKTIKKAVKKVVKTKEGYLLHRYPMFHWFPISAFNNDLDIKNFEDLARVKVKDFVNVK